MVTICEGRRSEKDSAINSFIQETVGQIRLKTGKKFSQSENSFVMGGLRSALFRIVFQWCTSDCSHLAQSTQRWPQLHIANHDHFKIPESISFFYQGIELAHFSDFRGFQMALSVPETINWQQIYRPNTLNQGKMALGTRFGHLKVVFVSIFIFWPCFWSEKKGILPNWLRSHIFHWNGLKSY